MRNFPGMSDPAKRAYSPFATRMRIPPIRGIRFGITLFLLTGLYYAPYFDLSNDIIRKPVNPTELYTDLTPQFGVQAEIVRQFLFDHFTPPHWNPYIAAGQPFLAEPGTRFLSIENLLVPFFRGQVAARLAFPLHILLGWFGLHLFLRTLGFRKAHSIIAGMLFLLNPTYMAVRNAVGHTIIILGVCILPWVLYVAIRPFKARLSRPLWAALLLGLMVHSGAGEVFLFTCLFGFPAYFCLRGLCGDGWFKAGYELLITVAATAGIAMVKILPALDFVAVSCRHAGMALDTAFGARSYHTMISPAGYYLLCNRIPVLVVPMPLLVILLLLAAAGAVWLFLKNRHALWIAALVLLGPILVSFWRPAFALLWMMPGFSNQRVPDKSLFVSYMVFSILVVSGTRLLTDLTPARYKILSQRAVCAFAVVLVLCFTIIRPPFPTMDDAHARRNNNAILHHICNDTSFFRLTSFQDSSEHWGYEHQTVPLKIPLLMGYPRLWHNDFLYSDFTTSVGAPQFPFVPLVYRNYATMTGLLSVKYVMSTDPVEEDGLTLVGKFPIREPEPLPPKSRGPYLYRNERSMPRVYSGTRTLLLAGDWDWVRGVGLQLLTQKGFDPRKVTLLYGHAAQAERLNALCSQADWILPQSADAVPSDFRFKLLPPQQLGGLFAEATPFTAIEWDEKNPQHLTIDLTRSGWVILSEKFAMFNGWNATAEGRRGKRNLPIYRCNHVNTAVFVPDEDFEKLVLTYKTPYFDLGMVLMGITLLGMASYFAWPAVRRIAHRRPGCRLSGR